MLRLRLGDIMRTHRSLAVASVFSLVQLCLTAQETTTEQRREQPSGQAVQIVHEQPGAAAAKVTVWVSYPHRNGDLPDHQQYLEDLATRFRDRGLAVAITLPEKDAKVVAAKKPRLVVAAAADEGALDDIRGMSLLLTQGTSGEEVVVMRSLDTAVDTIEKCLKGEFDLQAHRQGAAGMADNSSLIHKWFG